MTIIWANNLKIWDHFHRREVMAAVHVWGGHCPYGKTIVILLSGHVIKQLSSKYFCLYLYINIALNLIRESSFPSLLTWTLINLETYNPSKWWGRESMSSQLWVSIYINHHYPKLRGHQEREGQEDTRIRGWRGVLLNVVLDIFCMILKDLTAAVVTCTRPVEGQVSSNSSMDGGRTTESHP